MKLLFDQNLSYRLCRSLDDVFPDSQQVARAGLASADDISVWSYAGRHGLVARAAFGEDQSARGRGV